MSVQYEEEDDVHGRAGARRAIRTPLGLCRQRARGPSRPLEFSAHRPAATLAAMAQQRKALWESDLDEDLHDVNLNLAIGTYGQNGLYDDGEDASHSTPEHTISRVRILAAQPRIDESTLLAVQQQVAQQAALAQVPDPVKRVRHISFYVTHLR